MLWISLWYTTNWFWGQWNFFFNTGSQWVKSNYISTFESLKRHCSISSENRWQIDLFTHEWLRGGWTTLNHPRWDTRPTFPIYLKKLGLFQEVLQLIKLFILHARASSTNISFIDSQTARHCKVWPQHHNFCPAWTNDEQKWRARWKCSTIHFITFPRVTNKMRQLLFRIFVYSAAKQNKGEFICIVVILSRYFNSRSFMILNEYHSIA